MCRFIVLMHSNDMSKVNNFGYGYFTKADSVYVWDLSDCSIEKISKKDLGVVFDSYGIDSVNYEPSDKADYMVYNVDEIKLNILGSYYDYDVSSVDYFVSNLANTPLGIKCGKYSDGSGYVSVQGKEILTNNNVVGSNSLYTKSLFRFSSTNFMILRVRSYYLVDLTLMYTLGGTFWTSNSVIFVYDSSFKYVTWFPSMSKTFKTMSDPTMLKLKGGDDSFKARVTLSCNSVVKDFIDSCFSY